jgi:hypothetical protein
MKDPQGISLRIQFTPDPELAIGVAAVDGQPVDMEIAGVHLKITRLKLNELELGAADGVVQRLQVLKETGLGSFLAAAIGWLLLHALPATWTEFEISV